jgi:hypothetical protein
MKYKISTYVLLVVLAGFIIYSCGDDKKGGGTEENASDTTEVTEEMIAGNPAAIDPALSVIFPKMVDPDSTGEFISQDSARKHSKRYRDHRNVNHQLKKEPYGFGFGLNKLKELIRNIDAENAQMPTGDTSRITGVRIFLVRKHTTGKPHMDMLIVPCKRSGYNYISIGDPNVGNPGVAKLAPAPEGDPNLLLNRSSPCPDMCDGGEN